jgi:putative Mg2+ transporter-C (MgtC) family protein
MNDLAQIGDHVLQLAIAFLLALPIAWDREMRERSAGLRTFTLVSLATCGYLIAARNSFGASVDAESRVWQGLLTGIGFIGSGAILKTGDHVRGTATAASIWTTAAVGAAVAYRNYDIAVVLSLANFAVLRALGPVKAPAERSSDAADVDPSTPDRSRR